MATVTKGYVKDNRGNWYVQLPADNAWGFILADDDQTFDFPPAGGWELVAEEEVPGDVKDRLGFLLDD